MKQNDMILQLDAETGRGQFVEATNLDEATRALLQELRDNPNALNPHLQRLRELDQQPLPVAFVGPGIVPPSALALVVRDPAAEPSRLIVFDENEAHDWGLTLARKALLVDEFTLPAISERRIVTVLASGQGIDEAGEPIEPIRPLEDTFGQSQQTKQIQALRKRSQARHPIHIPGIGPARITP